MAMIRYRSVTRRIFPRLLSLDAVGSKSARCLQSAAAAPRRYAGGGSRPDRLHPGNYARCSGARRFYCDTRGDVSAHDGDRIGSPDVGPAAGGRNDGDLRRDTPQPFDVAVLVALLRQENAADICVVKVPESLKYTDYFVVVSGSSRRHLIAMAEYAVRVYKALKRDADPHVMIEGKDAEDWMCIDFGHTVVHFMLPETREVYELEKLWTLRSFDPQLSLIPPEILPKDFIYEEEAADWRSGFGEVGGRERS